MIKAFFSIALSLSVMTTLKAQKSEVFAPEGKAINGYDPVAFFKESRPVKGVDSIEYIYMDVKWLFATAANRDVFKANPEQFAPQYGGYCAYGASQGHKAPTQPETWTIVKDKLYFNYNLEVKEIWTKDRPALIEKADMNWLVIKDKK